MGSLEQRLKAGTAQKVPPLLAFWYFTSDRKSDEAQKCSGNLWQT
jgi:hypothetical protein